MDFQEAVITNNIEYVQEHIRMIDPCEYPHVIEDAATRGYSDLLQILLGPFEVTYGWNDTLCLTAEQGHLDCVKLLINYFDPLERDSRVLRIAAREGHVDVVNFLLDHCDPKAKDSVALCWAVGAGHQNIVDVLLPVSDCFNSDALITAVQSNKNDLALQLLAHSDVNREFGQALITSAIMKNEQLFDVLYPLTDIASCSQFIQTNTYLETKDLSMLWERTKSQEERELLSSAVGQHQKKSFKKIM